MLVILLATVGCATMRTPLISAVERRDLAAINRLLDAGANINEPSTGKWRASPLYWATYSCMPDVVDLLLKRGASINVVAPDGGTLLLAASVCGEEMHPVVKSLIEKGDKVNAQDTYQGWTPLISASYYNAPKIAKTLLKGGADVNIKAKDGRTALDYAKYYQHNDIIALLSPGNAALLAKDDSQNVIIPVPKEVATDSVAGTEQKIAAAPVAEPATIPAPVPQNAVEPVKIPENIVKSGYTLEYYAMVTSLASGSFDAAFAHTDKLSKQYLSADEGKKNRYLSLLERGKVALAARKYDLAIADLQEAEKRFLSIEGTISLTEGFGSILTDDTAMEYEAEMHEKLMISPYLIVAYLGKGDFNGAIVERNRTITKINQFIEEKPVERAYLENPFARYLTALMYEMEDRKDDAKIEYKKLKWDHEIARLESKTGKTTDLVILMDIGLAPQKFQTKWGPAPIPGVGVVGYAYAEYAPTPTRITTCNINIDGKSAGSAKLLYDLENTIITQYQRSKPDIQAKIMARMTAKAATQFAAKMAIKEVAKNIPFASLFAEVAVDAAGAAWIAAEQADLRGWLSLPKKINYLRVTGLEPGEHTISIDYGCGVETKNIRVEKDKINIAHFVYAK